MLQVGLESHGFSVYLQKELVERIGCSHSCPFDHLELEVDCNIADG